jgi:hypothetical protein
MPRNVFEAMDQRAAAAVGRLLEEPCTWRPMLGRATGGGYTKAQADLPDPSRPVREGLRAIVTWRDAVSDATKGDGGNIVAGGQLIVDLDRTQFGGMIPRKGDILELPEQKPGERLVLIVRPMDDGSTRVLYVCQVA